MTHTSFWKKISLTVAVHSLLTDSQVGIENLPASKMPFEWCFAGLPIVAQACMLNGRRFIRDFIGDFKTYFPLK